MKHLNSYDEYNEGIKSKLAGIGLAGSLLLGHPDVKSQNPYNGSDYRNFTNLASPFCQLNPLNPMSPINPSPLSRNLENTKKDTLRKISELELEAMMSLMTSQLKEVTTRLPDDTLSKIMKEIESSANSGGDSTQFNKLFGDLTKYMKSKYGYQIPNRNIEQIDDQTIIDIKNGLDKKNLINLMGWLGSLCLALCGLPQAWSSYKDKNSHGISWAFLALWALGEIFAMIYVYGRMDLPMMLNYGANILILSVMIYYKVKPGNEKD